MRHPLALALCLLPGLASAQLTFSEVSLGAGARNDGLINLAECNGTAADTLNLTWTPASLPSGTTTQQVWASAQSDCAAAASRASVCAPADGTTSTCSASLHGLVTSVGLSCTSATALYFCVFGLDSTGTQLTASSIKNNIPIDFATPLPPLNVSVQPGDSRLRVSWTAADTLSASYIAHADTSSSGEVTSTSAWVSGLTNGQAYTVTVSAFSQGGNPSSPLVSAADCTSTPTAVANCTPTTVDDFWTLYHRNGREQGGCGQGGAAGLALLALAPLLPRLRRRRP